MSRKAPAINLLKKNDKNIIDTVLDWSLTIGRIVVILTEAIALSAFLYRFSLDRQLIDLHDEINQKQAFVKLLKSNEEKFRNLQQRLDIASKFSASQLQTTQVFTDVTSMVPDGFTVNKFLISAEGIKIDGNASSPSILALLVNSLKKYPSIARVSLDRIENKTTSATIAVSITATLKTQTK